MTTPQPSTANDLQRQGTEVVIRLGVLILLVVWCFQIVRPFILPIVWGAIIAVATYSVYRKIRSLVGERDRLAAVLYILLAFVLLLIPAILLTETLVDGVGVLEDNLKNEAPLIDIPEPPESVAKWPIIGERLHTLWAAAHLSLENTLNDFAPDLQAAGGWLVSKAAGVGFAIVQFVVSIIIAGVFLAYADGGARLTRAIATRLAGVRGVEFAELTTSTVRSVARGVLGVALIQSILAGLGFLAVGLPAAGLWAISVLFLAVVQLPVLLILAPIVLYVFSSSSFTAAVVFAIWCALVGLSDNVLKPILLGRGAPVPMLVIFVGVIGGFVADGIIGLFTGAIVLALGYRLFLEWLDDQPATA